MEDQQTVQELTIQARAILSAIPGVLFALWIDHFERSFLADSQTLFHPQAILSTDSEATQKRKHEHNRQSALAREQATQLLRAVGFTAFLTQLLIYFSLKDAPGSSGLYSLAFATLAIAIQWKQLRDTERKLTPPLPQVVQPPQDPRTGIPFRKARKGNNPLTLLLSFTAYFFLVAGSSLGFFATALTLGARPESAALIGGLGILFGIIAGVALIYALAPWNLRRLYPSEKLRDISTLRSIEKAFRHSKIPTPQSYILEHEDLQSHNAMIAGFQNGKWIFKPTLFITRSLIEKFSPNEIESIILHELSHVVLQHLKKRLQLTGALIAGFVVFSVFTGITLHFLLPETWARLVQMGLGILAVTLPFPIVKRQIRRQELEADRFAITHLGSTPEAAISALEKLDQLNLRDPKSAGGSHPSTEERVALIREAAKDRKILRIPEKNADQTQKKAV